MRVLLDECMPVPLVRRLADLSHVLEHTTRVGLGGVANGALYQAAVGRYDLLVTSDRHFRDRSRFPVQPELGVVLVRIVPNTTELVAPALRRLLTIESPAFLVGHRTILRRDGWEHLE